MTEKTAGTNIEHLHSRPLLTSPSLNRLFVKKRDELEIATKAINNRYNILITGERGSGKTTFLYKLLSMADELAIMPIIVDVAAYVGDAKDFINYLLMLLVEKTKKQRNLSVHMQEEIYDSLSDLSLSYNIKKYNAEKINLPIDMFDEKYAVMQKMAEILRNLSDNGSQLYFFVDNLSMQPDLFAKIFGQLRDYLWDLDIRFVVTCNKDLLSRIYVPPFSSFFEIVIEFKSWSMSEINRLLKLRNFNKSSLTESIHRLSGGNPHIAISIARSVVLDDLNKEDIVKSLLLREKIQNSFSSSEKIVMDHISKYGSVSSSNTDLIKATKLGRTRLVQILKKLKEDGHLVTKRQGRKVLYRLKGKAMNLLGENNES